MVGSNVAIIAEGSNELICKGVVTKENNGILVVRAFSKVRAIAEHVSIIETERYNQTKVYEGTLNHAFLQTLTLSDVSLVTSRDRRHETRYPTSIDSMAFDSKTDFTVHVSNVSLHGLFIRSPQKIHIGDTLAFQMPIVVDGNPVIFTGKGKVVRSDGEDGYGIQLLEMSDADYMQLHTYIRRECC